MANGNFAGGDGTKGKPYLIEDAHDLNQMRSKLTSYFKLINHIDLGIAPYNEGSGWTPVGSFRGELDGGNYTINNLFINRNSTYQGLFSRLSSGTVKNVKIQNASIKSTQGYVGILSGESSGSGTTIEKCEVSGGVTGSNDVGGLIGYINGGTIRSSLSKGRVEQTASSGNAGGLAGRASTSTRIESCYSLSEVYSNDVASGLIGTGGTLNSCYAAGFIESKLNKSAGLVYGTATIEDSFWDKDVAMREDDGTGRGLSTIEMKKKETFTDAMWDTAMDEEGNILWEVIDGFYPFLVFEDVGPKKFFLSTTRLAEEKEDVYIDFYYKEGEEIQHALFVNGEQAIPVSAPYISPGMNRIMLPKSKILDEDINLLSLNILTSDQPEIFTYSLIKEDRDSFIIYKDFGRDSSIVEGRNIKMTPGQGISTLSKEEGEAEIITKLPTDGRYQIDNLSVIQESNIAQNKIIKDYMEHIESTEEGSIYEYELDIDKEHRNITKLLLEEEGEDIKIVINRNEVKEASYLVSNGNGNWYGYVNDEWIIDYNMKSSELKNIPSEAWSSEIFKGGLHKHELIIKTVFFEDLEDGRENFFIKNIVAQYKNNEAPLIIDPSISVDEIHGEHTEVTGTVKDLEGDSIEYRVLVKKAKENDFEEVNTWQKIANGDSFFRAYNYAYFNPGENIIKIEARDQRGEISSATLNVLYTNLAPEGMFVYDVYGISGSVKDIDGDDVTYRIFINDKMVFDYLPLDQSPRRVEYSWDSSDLVIGVMNDIKVQMMDEFGLEVTERFQILGEYQGVMFKDQDGFYYSRDDGGILSWLDFGVMFGGQISLPKKVIVENKNKFHIEDLKLSVGKVLEKILLEDGEITDEKEQEGVEAELSLTEMPFESSESIKIKGVLRNEEASEFYVRIKTDKYSQGNGEFLIETKAKQIDESPEV